MCVCVCVYGSTGRCTSCSLVPLAEGGAAVGTPSLTQCEAEKETKGEEEDGAHDPQASEVILQDTNSATHTHTHTLGFRILVTNYNYGLAAVCLHQQVQF